MPTTTISRTNTTEPGILAVLRDRRIAALSAARLISITGNGFGRIALAFGVLHLGLGAGGLSIALACQALPQLLLVLVGGLLGDRLPRHLVLAASDIAAAAAWVALTILFVTGHGQLWLVAALAVVTGAATAVFSPAMEGVVPDLVAPDSRRVLNAFMRQINAVGLIAGLSLAGVVVAAVGPSWAAALNAASFAISAILLLTLRLPARTSSRAPLTTQLGDGWREFISHRWLVAITVQYAIVIAATNAVTGVLGPLATSHGLGGARTWGILTGAQAAGALAGGIAAARLKPSRPILIATLMTFPAAVPAALLAVKAPVAVITIAMFTAGTSQSIFGVLWSTTVQTYVPADRMSRVTSWDLLGALALAPLGLLAAGPAAAHIGLSATLTCVGVLVSIATAATLLVHQIRHLPAHPRPDSDPATAAG